jgi:hypothetical protein
MVEDAMQPGAHLLEHQGCTALHAGEDRRGQSSGYLGDGEGIQVI